MDKGPVCLYLRYRTFLLLCFLHTNPPPLSPTSPTPCNLRQALPRGLADRESPLYWIGDLNLAPMSFCLGIMNISRTTRSGPGLSLIWVMWAAVLGVPAVWAQRGPLVERLGDRFQSVGYEINPHSTFAKMSTMSANMKPAAGGRPKL